jgi:4-amino-4-deoxy-L-arabinose transferase-like glycosyltransferase
MCVCERIWTVAFNRKLLWVSLFAFAVRATIRWNSGSLDFWENGYTFFFELAQNIAGRNVIALDGGPATAFRVPLYPIFLAAVTFGHQQFIPIVLAQSLVGAGTVWCAAILTKELFGKTAAIIAAVLTSIYPYYVVHDTALQETSLFTFLTVFAVILLLRVHRSGSFVTAMCAGLALGAAILTRATLVPFALFAPFWLAVCGGSDVAPWRRRIWAAVLCAGVGTLTVSPWLLRNDLLTGSVTISTEAGFFLWVGNNAYTFSRYPKEDIDTSTSAALEALSAEEKLELKEYSSNEATLDAWFREKAADYIRAHPWQSLVNCSRKVVNAFGWLLSPGHGFWPNLAHGLSYGPMTVLGLWGMWAARRHWREHSIFYAQFVSFAAVTAVFFGATSYRSYLDVYLIVFAAGVLAPLLSRVFPKELSPRAEQT